MSIQEKIPHATINDFDLVWSIFKPYTKTYFPHIRQDYVKRKISANEVVLKSNTIITYGIYKRKQKIGEQEAQRGDAHIGQIATAIQGRMEASETLQEFFKSVNTNVWLTVRADNARARRFYVKNGMVEVGDVSWSDGELAGKIYLYKPTKCHNIGASNG